MKSIYIISWLGLAAALPGSSISFDDSKYDSSSILTYDVCIVGGGSTGTYSAIRLRDKGKSVVVIERESILGGHTNTYTVPGTNTTVDYGVVVFHDLPIVHNYFNRFNIPLVKADFQARVAEYVNFQTGISITNYTLPTPKSLSIYAAQLAKYSYSEGGFDLQYPVPSDLLLPFGDFVKKYVLEDMVPFIFAFAQGLGDFLKQPTLYVFKNFGSDIIKDISNGFLSTARHNNHEIYDDALAELGSNALVSSHVLAISRPSDGSSIRVIVSTPSGIKLIKASKLLVTIPPKLHNLKPFDLSQNEREIFGQFGNSAYYTGLLTNTGLSDNISYNNIDTDNPYNIPQLPGLYGISPTTVSGLFDVKYGSAYAIPLDKVKADILATVARVKNAGLPGANHAKFVTFRSHTPFELTVPPAAIAGGFYKSLYALQGTRNTWWTGAAFDTHDSSLLWNFTETHILPGLAA